MTTISQFISDNPGPEPDCSLHRKMSSPRFPMRQFIATHAGNPVPAMQAALSRRRARQLPRETDPLLQGRATRLTRLPLLKRRRAWYQSDLRHHLTQGQRKRLVEVIAHEGRFKRLLVELTILRLTQVHQRRGAVVMRKGQHTYHVQYGGETHVLRISLKSCPNKTQRQKDLNHLFDIEFNSEIVVSYPDVLTTSYFPVGV